MSSLAVLLATATGLMEALRRAQLYCTTNEDCEFFMRGPSPRTQWRMRYGNSSLSIPESHLSLGSMSLSRYIIRLSLALRFEKDRFPMVWSQIVFADYSSEEPSARVRDLEMREYIVKNMIYEIVRWIFHLTLIRETLNRDEQLRRQKKVWRVRWIIHEKNNLPNTRWGGPR